MRNRPLSISLTVAAALLLGCRVPVNAGPPSADNGPPSFRNDVMAVLTRAGCSQGACHGNMHGKGGFRLSLRGQDPQADYRTLTRGLSSRRVNLLQPADSLLLRKPLMEVPHEGGQRFPADSVAHRILREWIAAGAPADAATAPRATALRVEPDRETVLLPNSSSPIRAIAEYSDGSERDVTHLAVFESSDPTVRFGADGTAAAERTCLSTITVRYLQHQQPVRLEFVAARDDFRFESPAPVNVIDELVFRQLRRIQINPAPLCDDVTFLRRAYLDLTGLLPPADIARAFVASDDPHKRARLIDDLLESPEFCDAQALKWADLLRVEVKTLDETGVRVFHEWIRDSFVRRQPLNEFVHDLIAARGSTYKVAPANFYRALRKPEERSEAVAQLFLGVRLQCAKCHNHPFDVWTQDDYYDWTNLFARVDYEIVENKRRDKNDKHEFAGEQIVQIAEKGDVKNPSTGRTAGLRFLAVAAGSPDPPPAPGDEKDRDRLQQLADWLTRPGNRRFAEMQTNRIWYQMMGRGIVDPIDDFRGTNPPSCPELLDALTDEFVASGFDVRHLMRLIANSAVWQLASETNPTNEHDVALFSHAIPRRLTAEQILDGVARALDVDIPFGGHDPGTRAVQLVGVRNGGHRYAQPEAGDRFLKLFGKPNRLQTCECERSDATTLAQTFEMVSGELVSEVLQDDQSRPARAVSSDQSTVEFLRELYWSALSRPPTDAEAERLQGYVDAAADRRAAFSDVAWAVLNSNEFLLRR